MVIAVAAMVASICCVPAQAASGTISWLANHEPRGQAVPHSLLQGQTTKVAFVYERLITFDAASGLKMVVSLREGTNPFGDPYPAAKHPASTKWICYSAWQPLSNGVGCNEETATFARGPLDFGVGGVTGDHAVSGLANDDVTRITLTLATGKRLSVPLKNNAFLLRLSATETPARITAYNALGKVIESKRA